jgi:hypothetical protein
MTSSNTPILLKILERLDSIDTRIENLESKVNSLENVTIKIQSYIQTESNNKENECTDFIKQSLQRMYTFGNVEKIRFGNFYTPDDNNSLTDIDGCLFVKTSSMIVKNANGKNRNLNYNTTYFIESKHGLTMNIVHKKLNQFVTIMNTIHNYQNGKIQLSSAKDNFKNMVLIHDIKYFPKRIFFIFASDYIPENVQNYLQTITDGIDEETYNTYMVESIKIHKLMNDILDDNSIDGILRHHLQNAKSIKDIFNTFDVNIMSEKYRPTKKLSDEVQNIQKYKQSLTRLYEPFQDMKPVFDSLLGLIGYRTKHAVVLPRV